MEEYPSGPNTAMIATMGDRVAERIDVTAPSQMPMDRIRKIGSMCPKSEIFGYFLPEHREALVELRQIFMGGLNESERCCFPLSLARLSCSNTVLKLECRIFRATEFGRIFQHGMCMSG
jgi:hypothetical protein